MFISRWAVVAGVAAIVPMLSAAGCAAPLAAELRVATLNIAHGRRLAVHQIGLPASAFFRNLDAIARLLVRERPDVIALQEIDAESVWSGSLDQVQALADTAKYPYSEHGLHVNTAQWGVPIRYGTALLSRRPLRTRSSVEFHAEPMDTKGFVTAEIEFGGQRVLIVSVHLDFKTRATRARQTETLISYVRKAGLPVILMGDFNCQWRAGSAVRMLVDRLDLRVMSPESTSLPTYPADKPRHRIDWILISPELEFRTYAVWPDVVSDHLGVVAELSWRD